MAAIGLVTWLNRHGLGQSAEIVAGVLADAGHDVRSYDVHDPPPEGLRLDIAIFVERLDARWLQVATHNALLPNPEWFQDEFVEMLDSIDVVFAKTNSAVRPFEELGCTVVQTGFTSHDRRIPTIASDPHRWLHVRGQSAQKGTRTIIDVWSANPDLPQLTIVQSHPRSARRPLPANVSLFDEYLPGPVLQFLQNVSGVHLCPSEAEGWGHHIVEGLGVGAVVITTDAPPMNELVRPEWGVLCPYVTSTPQRLGTAHSVSAEALEATVRAVMERDPSELAEAGRRARAFYTENHRRFVDRITRAVEELARTP